MVDTRPFWKDGKEDDKYRKTLSEIGWTEEQIIQYDELALEDHRYTATWEEGDRKENNWVLKFTEYLMQNLLERGYSFPASAERDIARNVTKKLYCIGVDYDTELKSIAAIDKEKTCELPDGDIITVGAKRYHCAEELLQPSFICKGVTTLLPW